MKKHLPTYVAHELQSVLNFILHDKLAMVKCNSEYDKWIEGPTVVEIKV
jgi:hypothetical protein